MKEFGFSATPEFYLVNPQGKIIGFWNDVVERQVLAQAFDAALGANGPTP